MALVTPVYSSYSPIKAKTEHGERTMLSTLDGER